ncbi:FkbM family methyltransferase [Mycolicibacterium sp. GF69]|uniref:FkbM family methyltransferase n=1 Tax=Mycolicibacterium sp. GF69 TaxID=2267251 RepID=UPI000DCC5616|nr:FkbM family methyltransferase [Mycolicibacterium sp. GF69]RAV13511.1 FkbM family methyltransferase [Mycolicibacterium sp. GF69]
MIDALILSVSRRYMRLLQTDKERVGVAERWMRALLLVVPFYAVAGLLAIRSALRGPLTADSITGDGIRFRCRLPDLIPMYIYLFGTWEPDLAAFLRRRLLPGGTFVDVGANVGFVSALASKLVGPSGVVEAIEPCPVAIAALQEVIEKNDLTNTRIIAAAVSDHEHELPLFVGPNFNIGLTSTVARRGLHEQGRVPAGPLGSLLSSEELATARIIKIDVEGAEDRVLAGILKSVDSLSADVELIVELTPSFWSDPQLRPIDVLQPFLDRGFHVYQLPNNYAPWRYLWPADVGAPQRLRDLTVLRQRKLRLDVVMSRSDADEL